MSYRTSQQVDIQYQQNLTGALSTWNPAKN